MTDIIQSILAIDPSAQVSVSGDGVDKITWHDGNPNNITVDQILEKQVELKAAYDLLDYSRNREMEYPHLDELIVALWESVVEERTSAVVALEALRQSVKTKYPKPE